MTTRVLIDACVLYPSILRAVVLGCAKQGAFEPLWSGRILGEWRRAAHRNEIGPMADTEIALLRADWRSAEVDFASVELDDLHLPDENDRHVLAAAIAGQADELLTANTGDFPTRVLARYGVLRRHPDEFLLELALADAVMVGNVIDRVHNDAEAMKGERVNRRKMLQRSSLPRLAKWDGAQQGA
ncbi:RSP_2648 family PIN domain-containing protein [Neptunicoccus cionae]|uniref:PIN domain-containing protein n=1 Tax=Neptunicoccus cionae TaxID=2035344 RepID=A0A916VMP7_9RHOB|nr:PIN domain-containing protein [Amylibacter cionae]GGA08354.1 PIN domain-containing protein [Amylibacter cionae]